MTNRRRPDEYRLLTIEGHSRQALRALIAGPGVAAGVWYPVASSRDALLMVENLNLAYFYARDLKRQRPAKRNAG